MGRGGEGREREWEGRDGKSSGISQRHTFDFSRDVVRREDAP